MPKEEVAIHSENRGNEPVAIVGLACIYPDCGNPGELWENVLAQRRAFRCMPSERLSSIDYLSQSPQSPDRTYTLQAAVIKGYEFDRTAFRVMGSTFRSADLAHWLALDVASRALGDAGFPDGNGLPTENTGVILGNTLTGEFSRAGVMRLRWPYVRRVLADALTREGWSPENLARFLEKLEPQFKAPFPPVGEETLAGGLSNTIAGRICNYFNLKGGGYTVDGACASSLLAVVKACESLTHGDLDVAIAGGVDLSLDPFELVGFAKTNALASRDMLVYDRQASGFWPGEGCGFAVLMRESDARHLGHRIYARIRGWGISSDGSGGITRPEAEGQLHAIRRSYRLAGFSVESIGYFEGHGTGTPVGDATELHVLAEARHESNPHARPAAIGSIKANFGHTKAAAGIAGLIKTTLALHHQILPPTTNCRNPHSELRRPDAALRVLPEAEVWPVDQPLRAGVSAMGFGGINTHLVLDNPVAQRRQSLTSREQSLAGSYQDCELFLLSAPTEKALLENVDHLLAFSSKLAYSELTDLSVELHRHLQPHPLRAALVAASPAELTAQLERLSEWLNDGRPRGWDIGFGLCLDTAQESPRIGFLFPGQASPVRHEGGLWCRRFPFLRPWYASDGIPSAARKKATQVAQPSIVRASLAGLEVLQWLGIEAQCGIGHSLGELTALHWGGAFDAKTVLELAKARGKAMAEASQCPGAMAAIEADSDQVPPCLRETDAKIVGFNSSRQTVVAGTEADIDTVIRKARAIGLRITKLPVAHAFHTSYVAAAAKTLDSYLARIEMAPLHRNVISTITGSLLSPETNLRELLTTQITAPVRFTDAVAKTCASNSEPGIDLWIEVGPGTVLTQLVQTDYATPVISLDTPGNSLRGLMQTAGAAFVRGASFEMGSLFHDRFHRPFQLDWSPKFFVNPCELAPPPPECSSSQTIDWQRSLPKDNEVETVTAAPPSNGDPMKPEDTLAVVEQLIAESTELPLSTIHPDSRMLSDLHLNSITVSHLVAESARRLGQSPPISLTQYANATVAEIAAALNEARELGHSDSDRSEPFPPGIDSWVRAWQIRWIERPLPAKNHRTNEPREYHWQIFAPDGHSVASALPAALQGLDNNKGIAVCLPNTMDEGTIDLLLAAAQAALADSSHPPFVLIQNRVTAAGFARTLHLESPHTPVVVVSVPYDHPEAAHWVAAEIEASEEFHEASYDLHGRRFEPALTLCPPHKTDAPLPIGPEDVLCVTGGGKGIAAECALRLGCESGARLALVGRSDPETDPELAANLQRIVAAGIPCRYFQADVNSLTDVQTAMRRIESALGPITGLLHGAGTNAPKLLNTLGKSDVLATLTPKVQGFLHLMDAIDSDRLRLLITFSSIIARTGLPGEADYAVANEWLSDLTRKFQSSHPQCRCLAVEWSVWSGTGMGERLGRIESLMQQGITPITTDQGVAILSRLTRQSVPTTQIVVAGRFGNPRTVDLDGPDLPFLRFLEHPRVYYPGVELVVDAELSVETDPYLEDHIFQGNRLFPAVLGLEAMAQTAAALVHSSELPVFEEVLFNRPIVVPRSNPTRLRIAALAYSPNHVEVAVRCEASEFTVDHFAATCRFATHSGTVRDRLPIPSHRTRPLPLDPQNDLYGQILVHRGRFAKLRCYYDLHAESCLAEIGCDAEESWFGRYLPQVLMLGNPGERDAALHAIQACIPHTRILPVGMDRMILHSIAPVSAKIVHAVERIREGDRFIYDVWVYDRDQNLLEAWEGLHLKAVEPVSRNGPWPEPLLGPYLQRCIQELAEPSKTTVLLERSDLRNRKASSTATLQHLLRDNGAVHRRPDGRPETRLLQYHSDPPKPDLVHPVDRSVSASHLDSLVLAVAGNGSLGCDMVRVAERDRLEWTDLLQPEGFNLADRVARETGEAFTVSACRVWAAAEALTKAGKPVDRPLILSKPGAEGWVLFHSGPHVIATVALAIRGEPDAIMVSILEENGHEIL